MTSDGTGKVVQSPSQSYTQPQMFPLVRRDDERRRGETPERFNSQGEETIKLAGRDFKTQWFDSNGQTEAGKSQTRTWMSDEVPGKLVKAVTQVPSAKNTTTVELIELKIPESK